jgi:hypothetical protein
MTFDIWEFFECLSRNFKFLYILKELRSPAWSSSKCMISRWILPKNSEYFGLIFRENQITYVVLLLFSENRALREITVKNINKIRVTRGNIMLPREDVFFVHNRYNLVMCNAYNMTGELSRTTGFFKHVRLIKMGVNYLVTSVRPHVPASLQFDGFHEILYWFLWETFEKILNYFNSDYNIRDFTRSPKCISCYWQRCV